MFKILVLVISLADPSRSMALVSDKGFPSMQTCEAELPEAKKGFLEWLALEYGVGEQQVRVELKCEFAPSHSH